MWFTVSDLIAETLERAGVRRVYGIPGDSLNGFTDALHRDGTIVDLAVTNVARHLFDGRAAEVGAGAFPR